MSFLFPETRLSEALTLIENELAAIDLSTVHEAAGNASDATAYGIVDRLDQWAHLGIVVSSPRSEDTGRTDGREHLWMRDTVIVELRLDVSRVTGQRALRNLATSHEETIRAAILGLTQQFRPSFVATDRAPLPDRRWYALRVAFTVERIERAGPAA